MRDLTIQQVAAQASHTREILGKPLEPMLQVHEGGQVKLAALTGFSMEELPEGLRAAAESFPSAHRFFLMVEECGVIQVWELDRIELLAYPSGGFTQLELLSVGAPDG